MQINIISCQNDNEIKEIISLLKEKYKDNPQCKFRKISDTFILPDKKWIIAHSYLIKMLTARKPDRKVYSAEVIRNALLKDKWARYTYITIC